MGRRESAINAVTSLVPGVANAVLSEAVCEHYSEAAWQDMTQKIAEGLETALAGSLAFSDALTIGDLVNASGRIKRGEILAALERLQDDHQGTPGDHAKLKYLVEHTRKVFGNI